MFRLIPSATLLLLSLAGAVRAQSADASPVDADRMLSQLEVLEEKLEEARRAEILRSALRLQPATAGGSEASKLFEEAVRTTDFSGTRSSGFTDWRKNNAETLRSSVFQDAVQLHVRYLLLGLQHAHVPDDEPDPAAVELAWAYARDLSAFLLDKRNANLPDPARDLLQNPVGEGIFARWLGLADRLPSEAAWEPTAGNLAEILEKSVRGPWRAAEDPRLEATWQLQLQFEAEQITASGNEHAAERFNAIERPRHMFAAAQDTALIGHPNRAATAIFQLLQQHPTHPDFETWAAALRQLIVEAKPDSSTGPEKP